MNVGPCLLPYIEINFKWTINFLQAKYDRISSWLEGRERFLRQNRRQ